MITAMKDRLGRKEGEKGFTLIELMVVVLIIAILLAIAIPTFLGAKDKANARAGQSNLRNGLTAEQTYFTDGQQFGTAAQLLTIEPNISFVSAEPTAKGGNVVYVDPIGATSPQQVVLQAYAADGNCYTVFQDNSGNLGTQYEYNTGVCVAPAGTGLPAAAATAGTKASAAVSTWAAAW